MSEKPHCAANIMDGRWLATLECLLRKIKNFNRILRRFAGEILEINSSQTGSIKYGFPWGKAMKMQVGMDVCTVEAGQCIQ